MKVTKTKQYHYVKDPNIKWWASHASVFEETTVQSARKQKMGTVLGW